MAEPTTTAANISLVGGVLCLDFVNSVEDRLAQVQADMLNSYADLLTWGEHAGLISKAMRQRLLRLAAQRPEQARAVFAQAIEFREALYRILATRLRNKPTKALDLALLNSALARARPHERIEPRGSTYGWTWQADDQELDQVVWPIVRSAADLLLSEQLSQVGTCLNQTCGWLFLDTSRNHSRRWCDMSDCGNRAKARRYYRRKRSALYSNR